MPSTPAVANNPITPEKIALGKALFFDPRVSASGVLSCNSCHNLATGGDDNLETSIGHGWQKGPRNAPTVLNAVFNIAQFWDGRAEDLKAQAKGPIQAGIEMANTPGQVIATLKSMPRMSIGSMQLSQVRPIASPSTTWPRQLKPLRRHWSRRPPSTPSSRAMMPP
ncbi:hypothetical protein AJ88_38040 [Mesorhizobium amorphae CCBAU 01583]|nr:hypothetical protein AJ88_38040 [Mesorhizobium amorphae CCBAU 01583]